MLKNNMNENDYITIKSCKEYPKIKVGDIIYWVHRENIHESVVSICKKIVKEKLGDQKIKVWYFMEYLLSGDKATMACQEGLLEPYRENENPSSNWEMRLLTSAEQKMKYMKFVLAQEL